MIGKILTENHGENTPVTGQNDVIGGGERQSDRKKGEFIKKYRSVGTDFFRTLKAGIPFPGGNLREWILHIALAWFTVVLIYFKLNGGEFQTAALAGTIRVPEFALYCEIAVVLILWLQEVPWFRRVEPYLAAVEILLYSWLTINENSDLYFYIGMLAVTAAVLICVCKCAPLNPGKRVQMVILVVAAAVYVAIVGGTCVVRYLTYSSPAYDFGIWVQMFYYMQHTLQPLTTLERSQLLSHFAVHFSPIYYLYLPIYMIFPYEVTLQILQAVTVISGIIPLVLICRKWGFSRRQQTVWGLIYAMYPALATSCYFDLHENCFLAPLLLWLFWALETGKWRWILLFSVLMVLVKEDAAVYVACIGLYTCLDKKKYKTGIIVAGASVFWFFIIQLLMQKYGLGVMSGRYDNFMDGGSGSLMDVVKNFIANPAFAITQCVSQKKIELALILLLPVGFLPLMTGNVTRYILLLPVILINFASDYGAQSSIDFQYTFGTSALLIYLAMVNYRELSGIQKYNACIIALCAGFLSMPVYALSQAWIYGAWKEEKSVWAQLDEIVDSIPEEASVSASTNFATHLAQRKVLYEYPGFYTHEDLTDYVLIDLRGYSLTDEDLEYLEENNYEEYVYLEDMYVLYKLQDIED